ncbi:cytochrome P450 [Actinacidiphila oryziradicis]|uniref:Cytochrome P450 n=1 Tax=Actinacidiphila oryziradicis TaxID=2571141 RepID=A0A4U0RV78_9ACTN|nr:cytochrome P450 [Actinacidiphila oryziradicis]TJZ99417.1 cytochrome P450 [Actinacidiphila oryziradicis]
MSDAISYEVPWARTHQFDPPAVFDSLRTERPLAAMTYPDGHVGWLASSYELVRKVLADPRFSHDSEICHFPVTHQGEIVPTWPPSPGMFIHMDPPDHTRYRRLLAGEFTARRSKELAASADAVAAEQIEAMRAADGPLDLVTGFSRPFVLRMLSEIVGLPYEERERYGNAPTLLHDPDADKQEVAAAYEAVTAFIVELVEKKRLEPGEDLISRLVARGELTTEEVTNMVILLLFAGYETTESALTVGVFALLHHQDQLALLRAEPEKLDAAIEEILRYLTINQYQVYRTALEDVDLDGVLVKKGDTVTVSLPSANRDPAKFECPEQLRIGRETAGHLAFGFGVHQCLGQNLARVELRAGLSALLRAFPDLRLACAFDEVPLRLKGSVFGVKSLLVSW